MIHYWSVGADVTVSRYVVLDRPGLSTVKVAGIDRYNPSAPGVEYYVSLLSRIFLRAYWEWFMENLLSLFRSLKVARGDQQLRR